MWLSAIRFGQTGWLSGEGSWQWDRATVQIRALLAGDSTLCLQLAEMLRERGHVVLGKLPLQDAVQTENAAAQLKANVFGLCLLRTTTADEVEAARVLCEGSYCPAVVFGDHTRPRFLSEFLQAGAFACVGTPAHHSEILAILAIGASRFEQFYALRRRVADLEWSLRNPETLDRAVEVLAGRLHISRRQARQKLCAAAEWRRTDLRQLTDAVLNGCSDIFRAR
jgi:AmiR/NasT family two-component response regulator